MNFRLAFLVLLAAIGHCRSTSLYEYFTEGGINEGLKAEGDEFTLNGKLIKILSGSLHYFRVHPDNWRTRIRQYKAAGLNTIDIYVPWNLHEPRRDVYDFGFSNTSQFTPFLDLRRFVQMIKEEDMFAIFRPGPYICGEWEFGGLPSWLLSEHPMYFRTSFEPYQSRVQSYFIELLERVADLQFHTSAGEKGGPIIMVQIENEYGNYGYSDYPRDKAHLSFIKSVLRDEGIESLLFTSDTPTLTADWGNIDYELMTANFKWNSEAELARIKELRPNSPIIVTEYWPGWFDHWFEETHNTLSTEDFRLILGNIFGVNGSVNFYMFFGGTNFAYMNGANILGFSGTELPPYYVPDVTSYDYDAPLTEAGHYTEKYYAAKEMIAEYDPLSSVISIPEPPEIPAAVAYGIVKMETLISYSDLVKHFRSKDIEETHKKPIPMEKLMYNDGNGQSYGYIVYNKEGVNLKPGSKLTVRGHIRDLAIVLVDGVMVSEPLLNSGDLLKTFGSWAIRDSEFTIPEGINCTLCTLEIMVENLGRANFGSPHIFSAQKKGIWEGDILLDGEILDDWVHIPIEITSNTFDSLQDWKKFDRMSDVSAGPKFSIGNFTIEEGAELADTYFQFAGCGSDCDAWIHGAVFVNRFNVGRYFQAGPQRTLYIPGPILKHGINEIFVLESYQVGENLLLTDTPDYGPVRSSQGTCADQQREDCQDWASMLAP